jgi:hypothetical protein
MVSYRKTIAVISQIELKDYIANKKQGPGPRKWGKDYDLKGTHFQFWDCVFSVRDLFAKLLPA